MKLGPQKKKKKEIYNNLPSQSFIHSSTCTEHLLVSVLVWRWEASGIDFWDTAWNLVNTLKKFCKVHNFILYIKIFILVFKLKYRLFIMLCYLLVYRKVIQLYIHVHILFCIFFHYCLLEDIEYSSLCQTVGPCCLSILYIIACIC